MGSNIRLDIAFKITGPQGAQKETSFASFHSIPQLDVNNAIAHVGFTTGQMFQMTGLQSLNGQDVHLTFIGTVGVAPIDPFNVQRLYVTSHATSNIEWSWRTDCRQHHMLIGEAKLSYEQYASFIANNRGMHVEVTMNVSFNAMSTGG